MSVGLVDSSHSRCLSTQMTHKSDEPVQSSTLVDVLVQASHAKTDDAIVISPKIALPLVVNSDIVLAQVSHFSCHPFDSSGCL